MHASFDLPLPMIRHTTAPHRLWEAEPGATDAEFVQKLCDDLETMILAEGPDTVAAFIAEPVMAAGGVVIPPAGYFPAIQKVLRRYDVLLIADEVVTGFGRLGHWFGTQALEIEPDLITIAKGLTSAYVPLSGCLVSEPVWRVLVDGSAGAAFGHGYTYTSHPIAAAAAMANLDLIENEGLVEQSARRGDYLLGRLHDAFADHPIVGEVRGLGLMAAVEFVESRDPARAFDPNLRVGRAHHPRLPRARRDHACASRCGHDRLLAAARDHGERDRYDRRGRACGDRPGRRRASPRELTDGNLRHASPRLGLIVNPLAGLGGRVGLKGTDGADVQRRALELGASPRAPARADRALARLESERARLHVTAAPGAMGADLAAARGYELDVVGLPRARTTGQDTQDAARAMADRGIDLLLFAGGDGTARDILDGRRGRRARARDPGGREDALGRVRREPRGGGGRRIALPEPALGRRAARRRGRRPRRGRAARRPHLGRALRLPARASGACSGALGEELVDVGKRRRRRRGVRGARGRDPARRSLHRRPGDDDPADPRAPRHTRARSSASTSIEDAAPDRAGRERAGAARRQPTARPRRSSWASSEARACSSAAATSRSAPRSSGGPGPTAIVIVAGLDKLQALDPPWLRVDTGDPEVDGMLAGYRRVRYAPSMSALVQGRKLTVESGDPDATLRAPLHGELRARAQAGAARGDRRERASRSCSSRSRRATACSGELDLPPALVVRGRAAPAPARVRCARTSTCEETLSFLGGGCWQHHVPAICDELVARTEFVTSIWGTPSSDHGRNQTWFEFASQLAELIDMDFVGMPVYSFGCAAGHAIRMASRITGRHEVLVPALDRSRAPRGHPHLLRAARDGAPHRRRRSSTTTRRPACSTSPTSSASSRRAPRPSTSRTRPTSA